MTFVNLKTKIKSFSLIVFVLFYFVPILIFSQSVSKHGRVLIRIKLNEEHAQHVESMIGTAYVGSFVKTGVDAIDKFNKEFKVSSLKRVFPHAGKYEAKHRKYGLHLWYELELDERVDVDKAIQAYTKTGVIKVAEAVYAKKAMPQVVTNESPALQQSFEIPNDPILQYQWHFNNTGSLGKPLADINMFAAWRLEQGKPSVIVAVMDGGIQIKHPDLAASIWINKNELPGNGIDDDTNGYIDDVNGYDFENDTAKITPNRFGTHTAGTIAAVNNNGIGVSGIAGGSGVGDGVRLMSCAIANTDPQGVERAYIYAADNGAVISQNAWSYEQPNTYEQVVLDAIDYFIAEAGRNEHGHVVGPMSGGVVVFSSGDNATVNQSYYPASYSKVIAVSGTNSWDAHFSGSNVGTWVDLCAPADAIRSTDTGGKYITLWQTSSSSAQVSGIAALIVSKYANHITPQDVWKRILNTTDKIETLPAGCGSGRLNALNALLDNDYTAPKPILDLKLYTIKQSTATLTWTTPIKESGLTPYGYEIRYAKFPIDSSNFDEANSVTSPPFPFRNPAEQTYTLQGLQSGTKYYFAIKSFDLFGNTSNISNLVYGTTENAPVVEVSPASISLDIDVTQNPSSQFNLTLKNEGKGLLQYSTDVKALSTPPEQSASSNGLHQDEETNFIDSIYYDAKSEVSDQSFLENLDSTMFTATKYIVTQASFTLTHVRSYYKMYAGEADSVILQIYKGGKLPEDGQLIVSQRVFGQSMDGDFFTFSLKRSVYFVQKDTFWIVLKYPQSFVVSPGYDIGMPIANSEERNYYSINQRSWIKLGENAVIKVRALSKKTSTSWITLDPPSGTLASALTKTVTLHADASEQINGTYNFNVIIASNDTIRPSISIPATVSVTGQKPRLLSSTLLVVFDSLAIGYHQDKVFELYNKGRGVLSIDSIVSLNTAFTVINFSDSLISPGKKTSVTLRYSPVTSASVSTKMEIYSNDIDAPVFKIAAAAGSSKLPALSILPDSVLASAKAGKTAQVTFTIKNTGEYPAVFSFPEFTGVKTKGDPAKPPVTAYTWKSSATPGGPAFTWNDISESGSRLSVTQQSVTVPLPFIFRFYDTYFKNINISDDGFLSFNQYDNDITYVGPKIPYAPDPNNLIIPFWAGLNFEDSTSAVYVKSESGRFIVQYTNVPGREFTGRLTFQAILYPNGDIEYLYKHVNDWVGVHFTGIENKEGTEGIVIANAEIADSVALKISYPDPDFINQVSVSKGVLLMGEEQSIQVELSAVNLIEGEYKQWLAVESNDTLHAAKTISFVLTVFGQPLLKAQHDTLTFDTVYVERSKVLPVVITNVGTKAVELIDILGVEAPFHNTFSVPQILEPTFGLTTNIAFTPDQPGKFMGTLKVVTRGALQYDTTELAVIEGYGVISSHIEVNPTTLNYTLNAGRVLVDTLTISNTGGFPLTYTIGNPPWIEMSNSSAFAPFGNANALQPFTTSEDKRDSTGYSWQDNKTNEAIKYNWVEISKIGRKLDIGGDRALRVRLPFTFTFYGASYDAISVTDNGFLSLNNLSGYIGTYLNERIPDAAFPNNIIAALWEDLYTPHGNGVFYLSKPDVFIVQYDKIPNYEFRHFGFVTFQILLYPNGDIKFQYKDVNASSFTNSSTAGIENATGSDGLQIVYEEEYLKDSLAILVKAPFQGTISPGQNSRIKLSLNASTFEVGTHETSITLKSNDIHHPYLTIPVKVTILAEDEVMMYPNPLQTSAAIKYTILYDSHVKVEVLNKDGKLITTLINTFQTRGNHQVDLSREMLPEGIYYCRLNIGNRVEIHRIVVK